MVKKLLASVEDVGLIPGSRRSPGEENGNPFQYSCLKNSRDRGTWWAAFHGVTKSWTQLRIHKPIDGKTRVIFFPEYTSLQTTFSTRSVQLPSIQVHFKSVKVIFESTYHPKVPQFFHRLYSVVC